MKNFVTCTSEMAKQEIILEVEACTGFWLGNLRERDHWGDPDLNRRIILRLIFRKWVGLVGTGWGWLRIRTGGGHLWVR